MKNSIRGKPIPEWIIKLSHDDPIVQAGFQCWRQGKLTWEEMLENIVQALAANNAMLFQQCVKLRQMQPPPIMIIGNTKYEKK